MSEHRLSRAQWGRVLDHAKRVAAELASRRNHFILEGWSEEQLLPFDQSSRQYLRERMEVHIGTICLMRYAGGKHEPRIPAPQQIRSGFEQLIGRQATKDLLSEG